MVYVADKTLYKKLNEYYDNKKSFRKRNEIRVLELATIDYVGAAIYDSSKYSFSHQLVDIDNKDKILEKIYEFKPDIIMTQDTTTIARSIYNHKNILYINNNDYCPYIFLTREKKYPINEIELFSLREEIIQQVSNDNGNRNHLVQWDYIEDANFLDPKIMVSSEFQTDIMIAGTSNSSLSRTKQYIKEVSMPSWMLGNDSVKNDLLRALDMMIDEIYQRMDRTGVLIDDKKVYVDIFYKIISSNNLELDFMKAISYDDMEYFYEYLATVIVGPVFRYLIVKWIIDRGYNIALYGEAWKDEETTKEYYEGTIKSREELKQTYNKAKICIFTNPHLNIHFSVFEIIGSKSLCLAYENEKVCYSNKFSKYFEDGKSIALFHSREELYEKLDYYLNNMEHRRRIIEEGNRIMMENNICWENELSKAVHQAVKQAEENGMFQ